MKIEALKHNESDQQQAGSSLWLPGFLGGVCAPCMCVQLILLPYRILQPECTSLVWRGIKGRQNLEKGTTQKGQHQSYLQLGVTGSRPPPLVQQVLLTPPDNSLVESALYAQRFVNASINTPLPVSVVNGSGAGAGRTRADQGVPWVLPELMSS